MKSLKKAEQAFALVPFMVLMALSAALLVAALKISSSTVRSVEADRVRSERYFDAETSLNAVTSWMRENSQNIVIPFSKARFYSTSFIRTAPSYGDNDVGPSRIPTKIKIRGTNNSVILTNNVEIATAAFPPTEHIVTGAAFDPIAAFQQAPIGTTQVRLTLVDALPMIPANDIEPPGVTNTDYFPVFRVDAVTEADRGTHLFGYIVGNLFWADTIGIYGKEWVHMDNQCVSSHFDGPAPGQINAKCPVGSPGPVTIADNSKIFGSARSNQLVNPEELVCADYPNCTRAGQACEGAACDVPDMPNYGAWPCGAGGTAYKPDPAVLANRRYALQNAGCYNNLTIPNRAQVVLSQTAPVPPAGGDPMTYRYYINNFSIAGGNNATQLQIAPAVANATVEMYVQNIVGDIINANQTINNQAGVAPRQFRLVYLGTNDIRINGTSNINMQFIAPNARVILQGNTDFRGGIMAKSIDVTGSATLIYDEDLGGSTLNDINFNLRTMEQGYS